MSAVNPNYKTIKDLLKDEKFTIDDYQREYKWQKTHIIELIDDLQNNFSQSYDEAHSTKDVSGYGNYFLGSIIVSKRPDDSRKYLIDGQQRTTSLTLFLIFIYHKLNDLKSNVASTIESLIYSNDYGEPSFNLDIPERLPVLEALYNKEPIDKDKLDESLRNMFERYQDIENEFPEELYPAIEHFTFWLINKVGVIEIATDDDLYAYTIFESMNDRGKPLSPVDMLKAHLLANIKSSSDRHQVNVLWKKEIQELLYYGDGRDSDIDSVFIKAWLRAQYALETRERKAKAEEKDWEKIGNAFHRWIRDNKSVLGLGETLSYEDFTKKELPRFSHAYKEILKASQAMSAGMEAVYFNASNDFTLQSTVLLAPINSHDDWETQKRKMQVVATYLDIFIVRRVINYMMVTYSTVQYNMFSLIKDIRGASLEDLVNILESRLENDDATFNSAKNGERLGLEDCRFNNFTKKYLHYILARMTFWLEESSGHQSDFRAYMNRYEHSRKNPYEVEHLIPNNFSEWEDEFKDEKSFQDFRNSFAGLVLLPKSKNASYNDMPYSSKVVHYVKENLLTASLTKEVYENNTRFNRVIAKHELTLSPIDKFNPGTLVNRQKAYREIVECIWSNNRIREEAFR